MTMTQSMRYDKKRYLLISIFSIFLVGCVDTSRSFMDKAPQPLQYETDTYISSPEENLYAEHNEVFKDQYDLASLIDVAQKIILKHVLLGSLLKSRNQCGNG